jgi:hypothetical protein
MHQHYIVASLNSGDFDSTMLVDQNKSVLSEICIFDE